MGCRKILDLVWRLRKFCLLCVAGATEISNRNCFGNVKAQVAERGKWICCNCRSERLGLLQEKLLNALLLTDDLQGRTRHWKKSYYWQQLEGKLAGGIQDWLIVKVESD